MNVALDIDGTISDHPQFFSWLTKSLRATGHRVVILTFRDPTRNEQTRSQLASWGVEFDEMVIAESLKAKGELCVKHEIDLFFDDQDECIVDVPESVMVFKIRNGGNFDFDDQKWVSTSKLTHLLR